MSYKLISYTKDLRKENSLIDHFQYTNIVFKSIIDLKDSLSSIEETDDIILLLDPQKIEKELFKYILETKEKNNMLCIYIETLDRTLLYSNGADLIINSDFTSYDIHRISAFCIKQLKANRLLEANDDIFSNDNYLLQSDDLSINLKNLSCTSNGQPIELTKKEYITLIALFEKKGSLVSRAHLLSILDYDSTQYTALNGIIKCLRKKIGREKIATVNNLGYRINTQNEAIS